MPWPLVVAFLLLLAVMLLRKWVSSQLRASRFRNPEDLNNFITQVRADLEAAGLADAAARLAAIQSTAYTTGSEWLGELGLAVREIRNAHRIPREIDAKLDRLFRP